MLPGLPASLTYWASLSTGTSVRSGDPPGVSRTSAAWTVSECRTTVGTAVATSSSTGQTGALTSAFTSWLLPCLNSPTTSTRTLGSTRRLRVWASRAPRSARS